MSHLNKWSKSIQVISVKKKFHKLFMMDTPQITVDRVSVIEDAECAEDADFSTDDHLMNLKALTEKLRLETRRPSYLEWKARLDAENFRETRTGSGQLPVEAEGNRVAPNEPVMKSKVIQCKLSSGVLKGFGNIDEALSWLRRELVRHFNPYTILYITLHLAFFSENQVFLYI